MAATKELIKRIRLTSSAASISFYNIPQDFDDLEIVYSGRGTYAQIYNYNYMQFNNAGYTASLRFIQGSGSTVYTAAESTGYVGIFDGNSATANTFGNASIYIPNYTSANYKSYSVDSVMENNATTSYMHIVAGLWSNTAAITSISFSTGAGGGDYVAGSSWALYGYKGGSDGITTVS